MLRSTVSRPVLKSLTRVSSVRSSFNASNSTFSAQLRLVSNKRPRPISATAFKPFSTSIERYASGPPYDKINTKVEQKIGAQPLEVHPDEVSAGSSVRHVFEGSQGEKEADMMAGVKADLETIKETFSLNEVPRESLLLGAAGLIPYAATSASTVFLAYDINHAHSTGSGVLFTPETAHQLLAWLEPIQIGYGAVIISFLGAIHWGLEYAAYGGKQGYNRFAIGVIAPAVAWPTMLLPVEYALITQFLAFNFLYFADARATVRGWCPPWYSTYRFVLTFIAGGAIVLSLVGRGQIVNKDTKLGGPADKMKALRDSQWENLEREEKERRKRLAKEEEEAEAAEEDEGGEEEEGENDDDDEKDDKKDKKKK